MLDNRFDGFNTSFSSINMARTTSNSIYHGATLAVAARVLQRHDLPRELHLREGAHRRRSGARNHQLLRREQPANLDRSAASFDVRQRVAFSGVWELPFLRNCRSLACRTVGGWQFSGYGVLESGLPLTVSTSAAYPNGDYNADGTNADRPNSPSDSISRSGFTRQQLRAAFSRWRTFRNRCWARTALSEGTHSEVRDSPGWTSRWRRT